MIPARRARPIILSKAVFPPAGATPAPAFWNVWLALPLPAAAAAAVDGLRRGRRCGLPAAIVCASHVAGVVVIATLLALPVTPLETTLTQTLAIDAPAAHLLLLLLLLPRAPGP